MFVPIPLCLEFHCLNIILEIINPNVSLLPKDEEITKLRLLENIDVHQNFVNYNHPHFSIPHDSKLKPGLKKRQPNQLEHLDEEEEEKEKESLYNASLNEEDPDEELHRGSLTLLTTGFRNNRIVTVKITRSYISFFKDNDEIYTDLAVRYRLS